MLFMFEKVKKNFGFGCMRLPMQGDQVDTAEFCRMIDFFLENGFNYFDTAHGYLSGKSETALRECLVKRYDREQYVLVNKLSGSFFETEADIRPFFDSQLEACGVTYFDLYLMHAQTEELFEKYKRCRAYETAFDLKKEGKVKHVGLSFHDKAEVLDRILCTYPDIEAVQIQFNYVDYEDEAVEGRKCYEVCRKHGKPVIVMEPVKGGALVNLPEEADTVFRRLNGGSNAQYAIRFAAGFDGVEMVLSGMGNMDMMRDNVGFMKEFQPLTHTEMAAVQQVCAIFKGQDIIPCTACRYCVDGCPMHIAIPDLFACMNGKNTYKTWNMSYYYSIHTQSGGKAGDCIGCGKCEEICPQHLPIRELLQDVAECFETGTH